MSKDKIDELIRQLASRNSTTRVNAAGTLGKMKDARAVPALIGALKDKDWGMRYNAVWALGEIKDARAVPSLVSALKEENDYSRLNAARALGKIGGVRAVPPLVDALKDKHWRVQKDAAEALEEIISSLTDISIRETEALFIQALKKAEGREEKKELFNLLDRVNIRKNEILAPEVKKLKPPKRIKRKPKRRVWRAAQYS